MTNLNTVLSGLSKEAIDKVVEKSIVGGWGSSSSSSSSKSSSSSSKSSSSSAEGHKGAITKFCICRW